MNEEMSCPDCEVVVANEREALLHQCGVVLPEPQMAEEPKTLGDVVEAVQGLALQVNGLTMAAQQAADALSVIAAYVDWRHNKERWES